jgi:hypothetical protein
MTLLRRLLILTVLAVSPMLGTLVVPSETEAWRVGGEGPAGSFSVPDIRYSRELITTPPICCVFLKVAMTGPLVMRRAPVPGRQTLRARITLQYWGEGDGGWKEYQHRLLSREIGPGIREVSFTRRIFLVQNDTLPVEDKSWRVVYGLTWTTRQGPPPGRRRVTPQMPDQFCRGQGQAFQCRQLPDRLYVSRFQS